MASALEMLSLTLAVVGLSNHAQAQSFTSDDLARRTIERRAVEAVIWGMPAVNYDLMLQEMLAKTDGKVNQVVYWGRPLDWRNQTLTPNPDAIYFMTFFNTKDGLIVLDLRPRTQADRPTETSSPRGRCRSRTRAALAPTRALAENT